MAFFLFQSCLSIYDLLKATNISLEFIFMVSKANNVEERKETKVGLIVNRLVFRTSQI